MDKAKFQARGNLSFEEKKFVSWVLSKEANIIEQMQTDAINKYDLNRTGLMKNARTYRIKGAGGYMSGHLEISFVKYLRFHDMKPKERISSSEKRLGGYYSIMGSERATKKLRRQYHLYNKIVWGRMNALTYQLNVGFTEQVKKQLAEEYQIPI